MEVNSCSIPVKERRSGSALVAAILTVLLMSILVSSFIFDAHLEARITSYYKKRDKAQGLSLAGVHIAEMLMSRSVDFDKDDYDEDVAEDDRWFESVKGLSEGLSVIGLEEELGDGIVRLDIVPEPSRRNINSLKEDDLERLFEVTNVPLELWPELIDSFMDWIDSDSESRVDGGESDDYYSTLEPSYSAKNGPFDTVEELLLVKGFNKAILYGGTVDGREATEDEPAMSGLIDLLTVYGDGRVNVNAASMDVLMTLPGVDEVVAGAIIEEREGALLDEGSDADTSFTDVSDFMARIPGLDASLSKYLVTGSTVFRITSTGIVGTVERSVWMIAMYNKQNGMRVMLWREEGK